MESVFLPEAFTKVVRDITRWKNSQKWYESKDISWTRGILLHGKPGSGKSSFISALCRLLDIPIYVFDLSGMTNQELATEWDNIGQDVPAVILLEDFDNVFHGRKNVHATDLMRGVTFEFLLNLMSGVQRRSGILIFVTVNDISKVDEAIGLPDATIGGISSRPGRIDEVIQMPEFDADCRRRMANHILSDNPELVDEFVAKGEGMTGSQFKKICADEALERYWNKEVEEDMVDVKAVSDRSLAIASIQNMNTDFTIRHTSNSEQMFQIATNHED